MLLIALVALVAFATALTVHLLTGPGFRGVHREVRAAFAVLLGLAAAFVFTDVAHAQDIEGGDTVAEIRLSALTVTLVVSVFIPIVVGILTKLDTSSTVKGVVTLILNLVNAAVVGAVVADGTAVFSEATITAALVGMAISVASYLGFYKPVDLNAKLAPTKGL